MHDHPTEPGFYWVRLRPNFGEGDHWQPAELLWDDGRDRWALLVVGFEYDRVDAVLEWGPRIPEPSDAGLTTSDLGALLALDREATAAPWEALYLNNPNLRPGIRTADGEAWICAMYSGGTEGGGSHNARLIAATRNALPSLLETIHDLEHRLTRIRGALGRGDVEAARGIAEGERA